MPVTDSPMSTVFCDTWLPLAIITTRMRLPLIGTNSMRWNSACAFGGAIAKPTPLPASDNTCDVDDSRSSISGASPASWRSRASTADTSLVARRPSSSMST